VGNIIGIVTYKTITRPPKKQDDHRLIIAGSVGFAMAMTVFIYWQSVVGQSMCMTVMGIAAFISDTAVSICLVSVSSSLGGKWIPFAHGFYGIGALISPIIVRFTRINAYHLYPVVYMSIAALAYYYPTPEHEAIEYESVIKN
jgi:hypothetical protein